MQCQTGQSSWNRLRLITCFHVPPLLESCHVMMSFLHSDGDHCSPLIGPLRSVYGPMTRLVCLQTCCWQVFSSWGAWEDYYGGSVQLLCVTQHISWVIDGLLHMDDVSSIRFSQKASDSPTLSASACTSHWSYSPETMNTAVCGRINVQSSIPVCPTHSFPLPGWWRHCHAQLWLAHLVCVCVCVSVCVRPCVCVYEWCVGRPMNGQRGVCSRRHHSSSEMRSAVYYTARLLNWEKGRGKTKGGECLNYPPEAFHQYHSSGWSLCLYSQWTSVPVLCPSVTPIVHPPLLSVLCFLEIISLSSHFHEDWAPALSSLFYFQHVRGFSLYLLKEKCSNGSSERFSLCLSESCRENTQVL